ncbi:MAG TPA: hypothetical protein VG410_13175 [Solirubrobacteraceae bacterium]|jgi:hypothetical protein|nr:hypothetical protein [Solirubrobacteraceae bacterium]
MSTLMLILFLVVVLVPGVLMLGLGRDNAGDDREPRSRPRPQSGELPEILRRPLRARL